MNETHITHKQIKININITYYWIDPLVTVYSDSVTHHLDNRGCFATYMILRMPARLIARRFTALNDSPPKLSGRFTAEGWFMARRFTANLVVHRQNNIVGIDLWKHKTIVNCMV